MSFLTLLLTCICVFVGTIALIGWLTRFRMRRSAAGKQAFCPIESTTASVLTILALMSFLLLCPSMTVGWIGALFVLLLLTLYTQARFSGIILMGGQYLICLLGTLMLPQTQPLFQTLPAFIVTPALALLWFVLLRLTVFADRLPYFSFMLTLAVGVFFAFAGLLQVLPAFMTNLAIILSMGSFAALGTVRFWIREPKLGSFGATVIGFIVGGSLMYIASFGFVGIPVVLFSYVALEWIAVTAMTYWAIRHRQKEQPLILFERVWAQNVNRRGLIRFTSFCFVLLALLSVVLLSRGYFQPRNAVIVILFILIGMVVRYRNWGQPTPSYRDLFRDVRAGIGALKQEWKKTDLPQQKQKAPRKTGRRK